MNKLEKIDKNFAVKTEIDKEGIKFYNCLEKPFEINGVFYEDGKFRRMPEEVAKTVSNGVYALHANTAGGRVRFKTNSPYVAISTVMEDIYRGGHFPMTGSSNFDLYSGNTYIKTFRSPYDMETGYESVLDLPEGLNEITINMPLYSNVKELYIGLDENAIIEAPEPYVNDKPIVYYGSSITQGGCASRPGRSYQAVISRRFNCDYVNLGFSGSARGEDEMIEYIKNLEMSVFVLDYDHNAPTAEHLKNTHEKLFKAVRSIHPDIPVIMATRPHITVDETTERGKIIWKTYNNALSAGDKNVYFVRGRELMALCGNEGTVDSCHPTDFGFESMARCFGDIIEKHNLLGK